MASAEETEEIHSCFICNEEFNNGKDITMHLLAHCDEPRFKKPLAELNARIRLKSAVTARSSKTGRPFIRGFKSQNMITPSANAVPPEVVDITSDEDEDDFQESKAKKARISVGSEPGTSGCSSNNLYSDNLPYDDPPIDDPPTDDPPIDNTPGDNPPSDNSAAAYKCHACDALFNDPDVYREHMLAHEKPNALLCYICNKNFTSKSGLRQHLHLHIGEKLHNCRFCDKQFTMKSMLRKHEENHEMQRLRERKRKT